MHEYHNKLVAKLLRSRKAEALQWLRDVSDASFRNLGEMGTTEESIEYVQRLYDAGAMQVIAVEIYEYELGQNTGHLLVQLPRDAAPRLRVFELEREQAERGGFDGVEDTGQEYLYFKLD